MADHIADYCRYLTEEKHVQKNTLNSYARDLNQFQAWLLDTGITDLKKVNRDTVSEYLHHMGDQGKSPATITRSAASIRSFYNYMMQAGRVKSNPAKAVTTAKVERKCPEILTNREVELFLEQPKCEDEKGFRDHAMLELLYATGIRVSELIDLNVEDIPSFPKFPYDNLLSVTIEFLYLYSFIIRTSPHRQKSLFVFQY